MPWTDAEILQLQAQKVEEKLDSVKRRLGEEEKQFAKQDNKIEELKRKVTYMEEVNKKLWSQLLQGVADAVTQDIIREVVTFPENVGVVEALKGPLAPQLPGPTVTLMSESDSMEQETEKCKKSRRRGSGSREQREKDRAEAEIISAVVHQPPSVEQVEMTDMGKKESITIDTEAGERSDLVEEELRRESAEPEATSEDELLKDCKEEAAGERTMVEELVMGKEVNEEEDKAEVVPLRGLRRPLPAIPGSRRPLPAIPSSRGYEGD